VTTDLLLLFGVAAAICSLPLSSLKVRFDPAMTRPITPEASLSWVLAAGYREPTSCSWAPEASPSPSAFYRILDTIVGAVLLAIFGLGLMVAGAFAPDAVRGYPSRAPSEPSTKPTWRALVHAVIRGPVAFLAIFGACLTVASHLEGAWRLYTLLTAVAGLTMTIWTVLAFRRDAANTGLVQRGLILIYWTWIVVVGIHLIADPP
jgi:Protein of unknown function (DUF998)